MTDFNTIRVSMGRRPITIVELVLDSCANVYGSAPCTAAVGTTGTQKCFNTYKSCQDTGNYVKTPKTYKFTEESSFLPIGENVFPCIKSIDIAPTQIDPKGFSVSASVTITLKDFPHHDRGVDSYVSERSYTATEQGTFFGKLRARNVYMENRVLKVSTGYIDDDRVIYTQSRTYFIDRPIEIRADGTVKIVGKDALRFADAEKAKAPAQSSGILQAAILAADTSLTLVPAGVGADYPSSGTVRIDDEVMTYSSKSGDTLNGLTRGTDGTTAEDHDISSKVQLCLRFTAATIPDVLNTLLTTYAGLDSSYIPLADWNTENGLWLSTFTSTVLLTEPAGVKDLIEEIIEATGCILWWDDIAAEVKFKVIAPPLPSSPPLVIDETSNILMDSFTVTDLQKERISKVITYYSLKSPTADLKPENFRSVSILVDATGEGVNAYGTAADRVILNRWVPTQQLAEEINARLLQRYKETPRQAAFRLDAKDALNTGDFVDVASRLIQDNTGAAVTIRYLVTECREVEVGSIFEFKAIQVQSASGSAALIAPDATPDWTLASDTERRSYMFISNDAGLMSDLAQGPHIV